MALTHLVCFTLRGSRDAIDSRQTLHCETLACSRQQLPASLTVGSRFVLVPPRLTKTPDVLSGSGAAGGSSALVNTTPAKAPRAAAAAASPFSPKVPVMLDDILDEDSELLSFLTLGECSGETYAVRVTSKTPRREYSTSGGGEVFSFNIVDRVRGLPPSPATAALHPTSACSHSITSRGLGSPGSPVLIF